MKKTKKMDQAVRAGNRERGWNDPPEFLHPEGANITSSVQTKLNKRVSHSLDGKVQPPEATASSMPVLTEPPKTTVANLGNEIMENEENKSKIELAVESKSEANTVLSKEEIEKVLENSVVFCQENNLSKRICDDISKRIKLFSNSWPKLNETVRTKMGELCKALEESQYSKANEFHIQLMMDYPSEVCQWMSGIKRLIHEIISIQDSKKDQQD